MSCEATQSILIDLPSYFYLQVSGRKMATLVWTFYQGQLDPGDNIYLEQKELPLQYHGFIELSINYTQPTGYLDLGK